MTSSKSTTTRALFPHVIIPAWLALATFKNGRIRRTPAAQKCVANFGKPGTHRGQLALVLLGRNGGD